MSTNQTWQSYCLFLKHTAFLKGISHGDIAKAVNRDKATITKMFNANHCPQLDLVCEVEKILGIKRHITNKKMSQTSDI